MLGERATTEITRTRDSKGFVNLRSDAIDGGGIAGNARKNLERKIMKPAATKENYLKGGDQTKKLQV